MSEQKSRSKSVKRSTRRMLSPEEELMSAAAERPAPNAGPYDLKALVGQEVHFWRNERGLTGAKLAELAGVSASMLTKIEKGVVTPSLQTIVALSDALNVPVSMLFYRLQKSRYVAFVPAGKGLFEDRRGTRAGHIYEMVGHNMGHTLGIEPFIVRLDESSSPYPMFQEEGFKFIHMMKGEVIYRHGERSFPLKPGDSLTFDAMAPHGPEKLIKLPAEMLSVAAYSRFDPGLR